MVLTIGWIVFTQLCKHLWFVSVMAFAVAWSSVSVASVKSMQVSMQMQHQQSINQPHVSPNMQNMSVQEMKNHCIEILQQGQSVDDQVQSLNDCHAQLIQNKHAQHAECQDCALFSCQSSIVWFNSDIPKLITPNDLEKNSSLQVHYQVQHLVGHWQEILRPPKT